MVVENAETVPAPYGTNVVAKLIWYALIWGAPVDVTKGAPSEYEDGRERRIPWDRPADVLVH